ncbi:hypothetical protein BGW37DRAFT_484409 [Umbelopsis sp. PMI_123]|nr:hypothetical protein BGW37DRAFT_484409 [Umbelopsis sp. PMI_123]
MLIAIRLHVLVALIGFFSISVCAQLSSSLAQPKVTQEVHNLARQASSDRAGNGGSDNNSGSLSSSSSYGHSRSNKYPTTILSSLIPTSIIPFPTSSDSSSSSDVATSTSLSKTPAPTTTDQPTTSTPDVAAPTTTDSPTPSSVDSTTLAPTTSSSSSSSRVTQNTSKPVSSSAVLASSSEASSTVMTTSDVTSSTAPSDTATLLPSNDGTTSSSSSTNTGAIVGGVVGGVGGLALIAGLVWAWKVRRRKQAGKDISFYTDDMVEADFRDHDQSAPVASPMRPFVPPGPVLDEEYHPDLQSPTSPGYYDSMYAGQYMNQPPSAGYEDYTAGYGSNTETSSTTAPHSEYMANLMAQRARANQYSEGYDLGTEREQVSSPSEVKPDTQDEVFYKKPDSRE